MNWLTDRLTGWPTPGNKVLLEKLIVQKFPAVYWTHRFITGYGPHSELDESSLHISTIFTKIHSNIFFPSTPRSSKWSLPLRFSDKIYVCISHLCHACYIPRQSHPIGHSNNVWWSVQVTKLLIMQSSPASRHFLPLRSKYSPQHPVLYTPSSYDLSLLWETKWSSIVGPKRLLQRVQNVCIQSNLSSSSSYKV